ncbi:MAG TPA: hypothetical protein VGL89_05330 [Candidatus Koribacter sp.]
MRRSKTLYRPVGQTELDPIRASGMRVFPPRLPEQPIFYPVLTLEYARQIARDWNTRDERSGFAGYVLRFEVDSSFLSKYVVQRAGSDQHLEYWIPAVQLDAFNSQVGGSKEAIESYPSADL